MKTNYNHYSINSFISPNINRKNEDAYASIFRYQFKKNTHLVQLERRRTRYLQLHLTLDSVVLLPDELDDTKATQPLQPEEILFHPIKNNI